ncbi:MAG: SDR family oxidoreductase, partial [Candidatus Omnitrophica bacterium]|nr:SDR family oxidoreductase [Candidatus Omnitrophota bacterium]
MSTCPTPEVGQVGNREMGILEGKIALITGASRGIGKSIAERFISEGAKCIVTANHNLGLLRDLEGSINVKLDLSSGQDIDSLMGLALKACGRIDIFVNNAALFKQTEFESISEAELDNIFSIDFKGPFLLLQKVFCQMKKQNYGKIVNIASSAGILGSGRAVHYAACKAAVLSLTKSLAKLGGAYN